MKQVNNERIEARNEKAKERQQLIRGSGRRCIGLPGITGIKNGK